MIRHETLADQRTEAIASGRATPAPDWLPSIELRPLVGEHLGAIGLTTSSAVFAPGASLPPHRHDCGEAITVLEGEAVVESGGQRVTLGRLDCVFVPTGSTHAVRNASARPLHLHSAFASASPNRELVEADEHDSPGLRVRRIRDGEGYDLGGGTEFHDLFRGQWGAAGICGGWARFTPGSSLPCHVHEYDESITIISGDAVCLVEGRRYELSDMDTALVPRGLRHRFVNLSDGPMEMIWVYAGDEPSRTLVEPAACGDPHPAPAPFDGGDGRHGA